METPDEVMNSHKHSAATFGDDDQVAPFGEYEKGLRAAGDEYQENHNRRVEFIQLGTSSRILGWPRAEDL